MTISSRTPEGRPNQCPVCGARVVVEPTAIFGDAPCTRCGTLLWFVNLFTQAHVFEHAASADLRERMLAFLAAHWETTPAKLRETDDWVKEFIDDSVDVIELVMELEEEFDLR